MIAECAQIEITGSGTNTGSNFVSFPGAYSATDPGILISIYDNTGKATNGGKPYPIPGPAPLTCSANGGGSSGGGGSPVTTAPPAATTAPSSGGGGGSVPLYGQCGGNGYTGPTACASGTCKATNEWYSQCLP